MITKNIWLLLKLKSTTFEKFHQLYQKKQGIDQMQRLKALIKYKKKNVFDLIRKRNSDRTTNHLKNQRNEQATC